MIVNGRLILNSSKLTTSILLRSFKKTFILHNSTLYSIQKKYDQKYVLSKKLQPVIPEKFIRRIVFGGPGYTNFGHGRYKANLSRFAYFWYAFLICGFTFTVFFDFEDFILRGQEPIMKMQDLEKHNKDKNTKAKSRNDEDVTKIDDEKPELSKSRKSAEEEEDDDGDDDAFEKKSKSNSFRQRKIIEYENRIRRYSTPDKIFRYFATLRVWSEKMGDYEVFMTPEDFVRSLTYGVKQPDGLGLDAFNRFDPNMQKLDIKISEDSVFKKLSKNGLISFSDYIFLVTLLSTPTRHFEIAFHMFDVGRTFQKHLILYIKGKVYYSLNHLNIDGTGNLDIEEFEQLQVIIRNQTSMGQRHKDTRMTGSVIKANSILNEYFFGKSKNDLLTVEKFLDFQKQLQSEVIKMEFEYHPLKKRSDGVLVISEQNFSEMILAYAGLSNAVTKKTKKRIAKLYNSDSQGITLNDYKDFFQVLRTIHDIDTALKFYTIAGASIDKAILKHVSKTVSGVELSDHVINIVFDIFDENGDQKLSNKEFIKVMKKRFSRGLQTRKDTGFINFIESASECAKETLLS